MRAFFLAVFLLVLPQIAWGQLGVFEVPATDKSLAYLGEIFGTIPGTQIRSPEEAEGMAGSALIGQLVYIFNQIIFLLGVIIVSYTGIVGTVRTAQEGEFLGKSWSALTIVRAAIGVMALLPTYGGYNWIQITVMWFIVQGVGAANALWKEAVLTNATQGNIHYDSRESNLSSDQVEQAVNALFLGNLCMQRINKDDKVVAKLGDYISVFQFADEIQFGRYNIKDKEPICGAVKIPTDFGKTDSEKLANKQLFATTLLQAQNALVPAATDALENKEGQYRYADLFSVAATGLMGATQTGQSSQIIDSDKFVKQAIETGWIHAGSFYYQLTAGGASFKMTIPKLDARAANFTNPAVTPLATEIDDKKKAYLFYVKNSIKRLTGDDRVGGQLKLSRQEVKGVGGSILGNIFGSAFDVALKKLTMNMTSNRDFNADPILSMAWVGAQLAMIAEGAFWSAIILLGLFWLALTPLSCILPSAQTLKNLQMVIFPLALVLLLLLWLPGILLALYVPMIPYIVFTFTAFGWILLVIEAMFGASLIALTFIVPSEDEIGKAGHAFIILLGLFFRPALMVLGFIMGIQFLIVAMAMINFGFYSTLEAAVGTAQAWGSGHSIGGSIGIFGTVAIIAMYGGIAISVVHEAMSLIHVLPDKILRWMGSAPEREDMASQIQEMRGSVKKGSGVGQAGMKAGIQGAQQGAKATGGE